VIRDTDTAARLGGDEFTIRRTAIQAVSLISRRIVGRLLSVQSRKLSSSGQRGGVLSGRRQRSNLIKAADAVMYRAKEMAATGWSTVPAGGCSSATLKRAARARGGHLVPCTSPSQRASARSVPRSAALARPGAGRRVR
jgi:hypothetical protein